MESPKLPPLPFIPPTQRAKDALIRWATAAVIAERERCAVICDVIAESRMRMDLSFTAAEQAASAIRAQPKER